ncbi:helix-turn-helix domain-containing protein [Synechococcus sp. CCY9202]|nr:helix-turn-helix domain-containing protein [Synechococcus sp. CCY9202]MEA5424696.1 helix-turn-helix domain-containing protein [Synechococcus sp. CCY9202]
MGRSHALLPPWTQRLPDSLESRSGWPLAGAELMESQSAPATSGRQRVWVTTAEACRALGMSRETLRQLRLRGVLTPGKHYRRWGCTQGRGPLQWHLENVEATITGWSRRHLQQ